MDPKLALYGTAVARSQLGRFQIDAGPTECIPIWAAGPMYTAAAAQLLGNAGSAYRYGTTKVGGTTNLLSNGNYLYPVLNTSTLIPDQGGTATGNIQLLLGGTGVGSYDAIANGRHCRVFTRSKENSTTPTGSSQGIDVNGEFVYQDTLLAAHQNYGAAVNQFSSNAGTVTVTNGGTTVAGAGTAFTTVFLNAGGGAVYTPSLKLLRPGDVIEIQNGANSYYHRITSITGATSLTIFPAAVAAEAGAGLTYLIYRTGYGSWSNFFPIYVTNNFTTLYFAGSTLMNGNLGNASPVYGTVMGINANNVLICPQTTASIDVAAVDVALYKSYLLYGAGGAISWSVAGFPTAYPFGATDFPAQNISDIELADDFVGFEFVADQLYAYFRKSVWLVVPTGTVPEFSFYRLPIARGALLNGIADPQGTLLPTGSVAAFMYTRPICRADTVGVYVSDRGMEVVSGGTSQSASPAVDSWDFPEGLDNYELSWDDSTNSVIWTDPGGGRALLYRMDLQQWCVMDESALTGAVKGFTGSTISDALAKHHYRSCSIAFWNNKGIYLASEQIEREQTTTSTVPWTWASPLIDGGSDYPKFTFGGFIPMARGPAGLSPANLTWTIYGGSSPYNMTVRGTGTFDYSLGASAIAQRQGPTTDDAYIGVVLSGNNWIELAGILVYDSGASIGR